MFTPDKVLTVSDKSRSWKHTETWTAFLKRFEESRKCCNIGIVPYFTGGAMTSELLFNPGTRAPSRAGLGRAQLLLGT